jgi:hypothetical protein
MYPSAEEQLNPNKSEVIPMLIQDMNHIEVAQAEIVGGNAAAKRVAFNTSNTFYTGIQSNVQLGNTGSATAGAAADAISSMSPFTYAKADASSFQRDGVSSAVATSASAIQYPH